MGSIPVMKFGMSCEVVEKSRGCSSSESPGYFFNYVVGQ